MHAHGFVPVRLLPAVFHLLCVGFAAGCRGWEPQTTEGPAIRVYTDAAECPVAPGGLFVGVWSSEGPAIRRGPPWVATEQSAELYGVVCALDVAWSAWCRHMDLVMDNVGAIAQVLWGRASTQLVAPAAHFAAGRAPAARAGRVGGVEVLGERA